MTTAETAREHSTAAELEMLVALRGHGSQFRRHEWERLLLAFDPRTRRVVILHGLMGMSFARCAERLGGVTGSRADQIWRKALPRLLKFLDSKEIA